MPASPSVAASGTFDLGGDLTVTRLGYGAMRLTGDGIWGAPPDHDAARAVLRRARELGVDFVDTADSYGPFVSEEIVAEALAPYDGVTVATKGGLLRTGPDQWHPLGRPKYLRQCVEMSLRRLQLETIPLYQLHRIDASVPAEDQFGVLKDLQDEGKIRHVGLSEVGVDEIRSARETVDIVSVQNQYNLGARQHDAVVDYCEAEGLAFIPWYPLDAGTLAGSDALAEATGATGATASQVALAWLLRRSPCILPIPGTSSVAHLEENCAAADLELPDAVYERLSEGLG